MPGVADAFGFLAIDFFEALVVNILGLAFKHQHALVESNHAVGVALNQV